MWNKAICFPDQSFVEEDEDGIERVVETWTPAVRASFTDLTRDDEILVNQLGYTAKVNIEIHKASYAGQSYLKDAATGDIYDVKRSFQGDHKMNVILTCSKRERGKAVNYG